MVGVPCSPAVPLPGHGRLGQRHQQGGEELAEMLEATQGVSHAGNSQMFTYGSFKWGSGGLGSVLLSGPSFLKQE